MVSFRPTQNQRLERTYFGPDGVLPLKFLRMLGNDQGMLTHVRSGTEAATFFTNEKSQIGSKFIV